MDKNNEPIYLKGNGDYIINFNGPYRPTNDSGITIEEVEAYLLEHPEALIPEPVPPVPTQEELDAREVQEAKSYLTSTDWIVAKIGEAQMKGGDIAALLEKYAPDLQKREEARVRINEVGA